MPLRRLGLYPIAVGETDLPKFPGDAVSALITFEHLGIGGMVDVGFGLAPRGGGLGHNDVQYWIDAGGLSVTLYDDISWEPYTVTVSGNLVADILPGSWDCLKFIQIAGEPRDVGGNGFEVADWDDGVYLVIVVSQFNNLLATWS